MLLYIRPILGTLIQAFRLEVIVTQTPVGPDDRVVLAVLLGKYVGSGLVGRGGYCTQQHQTEQDRDEEEAGQDGVEHGVALVLVAMRGASMLRLQGRAPWGGTGGYLHFLGHG